MLSKCHLRSEKVTAVRPWATSDGASVTVRQPRNRWCKPFVTSQEEGGVQLDGRRKTIPVPVRLSSLALLSRPFANGSFRANNLHKKNISNRRLVADLLRREKFQKHPSSIWKSVQELILDQLQLVHREVKLSQNLQTVLTKQQSEFLLLQIFVVVVVYPESKGLINF